MYPHVRNIIAKLSLYGCWVSSAYFSIKHTWFPYFPSVNALLTRYLNLGSRTTCAGRQDPLCRFPSNRRVQSCARSALGALIQKPYSNESNAVSCTEAVYIPTFCEKDLKLHANKGSDERKHRNWKKRLWRCRIIVFFCYTNWLISLCRRAHTIIRNSCKAIT